MLVLGNVIARAQTYTGKVTAVKDGDTIEMLVNGKAVRIRLFGVDSPEKGQAFGEKARQYTSSLCFGKVVTARKQSLINTGAWWRKYIFPAAPASTFSW